MSEPTHCVKGHAAMWCDCKRFVPAPNGTFTTFPMIHYPPTPTGWNDMSETPTTIASELEAEQRRVDWLLAVLSATAPTDAPLARADVDRCMGVEINVAVVPPLWRGPTRVEVIDHRAPVNSPLVKRGRVFTATGCIVELSYQDDGRTLKVFVEDAPDGPE